MLSCLSEGEKKRKKEKNEKPPKQFVEDVSSRREADCSPHCFASVTQLQTSSCLLCLLASPIPPLPPKKFTPQSAPCFPLALFEKLRSRPEIHPPQLPFWAPGGRCQGPAPSGVKKMPSLDCGSHIHLRRHVAHPTLSRETMGADTSAKTG